MNKEIINEEYKMPFGIYKRLQLKMVPSEYLIHLYESGKSGRLTDYIESKIEALKADKKDKTGY